MHILKNRWHLSQIFAKAVLSPTLLLACALSATAQSVIPANDGTGTIVTPNGSQLDIQGGALSGDRANLFHSFQRFNLEPQQIANFLADPSIRNILSRITNGEPSVIQGLIQVTGGPANLYLINPAGVIFGGTARLNVPASFTATTATQVQLGGGNFEAIGSNRYADLVGSPQGFTFTWNQPGALVNAADLTVPNGEALNLVGSTVVNTGGLTASAGQVTLLAVPGSRSVRLSQPGSLLSLEIEPIPGSDIRAMDLPLLLTGRNPAMTGLMVQSSQVTTLAGTPIPSQSGTALSIGQVDASANDRPGGIVQILGDRVGLIDRATVNVSGQTGGGTVLIGGEYKGQGPVPNAQVVYLGPETQINADARVAGQGGRVIAWADQATRAYGQITAKGGQTAGDGGFVETSGKIFLDVEGAQVSTLAPQGQAGVWLLDPSDLIIGAAVDINIGPGPNFNTTASPAGLTIATLQTALTGGNVSITTSGGTGGNGDILLNAPFTSAAAGRTLTISSRYLIPNAGSTISLTGAGSNLVLNLNTVNTAPAPLPGTIQNAIDIIGTVSGTTTIALGASTYNERLNINKPVTLLGPNAGINPNTGTRGAEAIIVPSTNNTTPTLGGIVVAIGANNVTIDGVTIDGDNSLLSGGINLNGVDSNSFFGIGNTDAFQNTVIVNNIIRNVQQGLNLGAAGGGSASLPPGSSGNQITSNRFDNMPRVVPGQEAGAIIVSNNFYANIFGNVISRADIGIRAEGFNLAGSPAQISNNQIASTRFGIFHNNHFGAASPFTIQNNTVTANPGAGSTNVGIGLYSLLGSTAVTVANNNVTASLSGIDAWSLGTSNTVTVSGGTLDGNQSGIRLFNSEVNFGVAPVASTLIVDGVTVQNSNVGLQVRDNSGSGPAVTMTARNLSSPNRLLSNAQAANVQGSQATLNMDRVGIALNGTGVNVDAGQVTITNSILSFNNIGLLVQNNGNATINFSDIQGNVNFGVSNSTSNIVDARNNWWGAANGPSGVGPGNGDAVTINVLFDPFRTVPFFLPPPAPPVAPPAPAPAVRTDPAGNVPSPNDLDPARRFVVLAIDEPSKDSPVLCAKGGFLDGRLPRCVEPPRVPQSKSQSK